MKKKIVTVLTAFILCISLSACISTNSQEVNGTQNNTTVQQPQNLKRIRNNEQVDLLHSDGYGNIKLAIETELKNAAAENGATTTVITDMIGYLNTDSGLVKGWMTSVVGTESYTGYFELEVELDSNDNVTGMNWITIE